MAMGQEKGSSLKRKAELRPQLACFIATPTTSIALHFTFTHSLHTSHLRIASRITHPRPETLPGWKEEEQQGEGKSTGKLLGAIVPKTPGLYMAPVPKGMALSPGDPNALLMPPVYPQYPPQSLVRNVPLSERLKDNRASSHLAHSTPHFL